MKNSRIQLNINCIQALAIDLYFTEGKQLNVNVRRKINKKLINRLEVE
jgi:hypothetical protein